MRLQVVALWMVAACGGSSPAADAGLGDGTATDALVADATIDANPGDGDGGWPPLPLAAYEWQRVVHMSDTEDPRVWAVYAVPAGVLVMGSPEMVLYDPDGTELARVPGPTWQDRLWSFRQLVVRESGVLAMVFGDITNAVVAEYDGSSLALLRMTELPVFHAFLAEVDSKLLALGLETEKRLFELDDTGIATNTLLPSSPSYQFGSGAVVIGDRKIAFCATAFPGGVTPLLATLDVVTKEFGEIPIPFEGEQNTPCRVTAQGNDRLLVTWPDKLPGESDARMVATTIDQATGAILAGPLHGEQSLHGGHAGEGFDGAHYILMDSYGGLYPLDPTTLAPSPPLRIDYPENNDSSYGSGFAGAGTHSYAVVSYYIGFGPVYVLLQKLPQLP